MTLRQKQSLFVQLVAILIAHATKLGYELTFGETWRHPETAKILGMPNSLHTQRLAIDLNLFKDGEYLTATQDHAVLGAFWKTLHPLARWGGDFNDGNHYSLEHNGRK